MLVRFSVKNLLSFRKQAEINLAASPEKIHRDHVVPARQRNLPHTLRTAVFYGANGAGKSNLVSAIRKLQSIVVRGTEPDAKIDLDCFRLDPPCAEQPTEFHIVYYLDEGLFSYALSVTPDRIMGESLTKIRPTTEELIFNRESDRNGAEVQFGPFARSLAGEDQQFLQFVAKGTRSTQPFLTEAISRNVTRLEPHMAWFRNTLSVLSPQEPYGPLEIRLKDDLPFKEFFSEVLANAGTGISGIETEETDLETARFIPDGIKRWAKEHVKKNMVTFSEAPSGMRFALARREEDVVAIRLNTLHQRTCGSSGNVRFEVTEESDGTQRLFDLIPPLYELTAGTDARVYVIDEIGRSLHPHLVKMLFEAHLRSGPRPTQLIATTHDTTILDLDLLRRDEIWFVEKDQDHSSQFFSLHDFQPRHDKDVRRDYLVGRYGGIPFLGDPSALGLGKGVK